MNKTIFLLIKFAEKYEHVKELQKGKLYMRSVKYYRELEEKQLNLRGDENEGVYYIAHNMKIISNNEVINAETVKIIREEDLHKYIYCMYSLSFNNEYIYEKDLIINDEVKKFGDWFFMIINVSEFLRRVDNKLKMLDVGYRRKSIKYKDLRVHNGEIYPFIKDLKYNYQKEYRIWLDYYKYPSYILDIGDISDISMIGKIDDLFNRNIFNIQIVEK